MQIHELRYSNKNTYIIEGDKGSLLFDTGWAGAFPAFCKALGEIGLTLQSISYILISHFHPDHMGIAQEIAENGPVLLIPDVQKDYVHFADHIFEKEKHSSFVPIVDEKAISFPLDDGRRILERIGINGQILHTPGHSDDSISLLLDNGSLFVGDLNPLYELELHKGTLIE
ncbi:MAG: MBL fold metallo-hydrolase [Lachnospiraceae bacterium]|nr:MBL fold metallo-hydrolase [Lachnospiraceae bacterium]